MAMKKSNEKKLSLRTSKDVYDRIRWDLAESEDLNSFFIGYLDRFDGMMELSFPEYEPGGDIPWHRQVKSQYKPLPPLNLRISL